MKNVEYIWAPRFGVPKIDHPIGGIIRNIPVTQDSKKFKNPKGHSSGYVSWHNEHTSRIIDTCVLSKDPKRDSRRTLHIRVKDFSAILVAREVFDFGQLLNYAGATAAKWGARIGEYPEKVRYINGVQEIAINSLLPDEIEREARRPQRPSIEIRVGNVVAMVGLGDVFYLEAHCGIFLRKDEEYREMVYPHLDPCNFFHLFRKVLASTWRR